MTSTPDLTTALQHVRDLQAEAASARLARLVSCCRPSALRRTATSLRAELAGWLRRGQLQTSQACCAWPV